MIDGIEIGIETGFWLLVAIFGLAILTLFGITCWRSVSIYIRHFNEIIRSQEVSDQRHSSEDSSLIREIEATLRQERTEIE